MIGDNVEVFNRAPFPLTAIKDGRSYRIPVGRSWLRSDVIPFAKAQNPIMGSEDPTSPYFESLVSVVAPAGIKQLTSEPLDPIPQAVIDALPKERLNRNLMDSDRQQNVEEIATTFPQRRVGIESPTEGMTDPGKFS